MGFPGGYPLGEYFGLLINLILILIPFYLNPATALKHKLGKPFINITILTYVDPFRGTCQYEFFSKGEFWDVDRLSFSPMLYNPDTKIYQNVYTAAADGPRWGHDSHHGGWALCFSSCN